MKQLGNLNASHTRKSKMKKILLLILLLMFLGCQYNNPDDCSQPKFKEREIIVSVVGNHTGQITRVRNCREGWGKNYYDVRFETGLSTITWMNEYEFKKIDTIKREGGN